jgi:CBS domain-containing membrane protein
MKKREPVSHIMTKELFTVNTKDDLHKAEELLTSNKVRHLPVVSGENLIGIISKTDIMRISYGSNFKEGAEAVDNAIFDMLTLDQVMQHQPKSVNSTQTIKEVAEILSKEEFHALPVVDDDKLVGIVTTTDVIKYLIDQY